MDAQLSPFRVGWWSFDLPGYRACDGTYCLFPYETLPPLNVELRGEFQWLSSLESHLQSVMSDHRSPQGERNKLAARLERLMASAPRFGLKLPEAFIKFMSTPALQDEIPSCTACYFDLPDRIVQSPVGDNSYLIRFLNDQQGVLFWYLYLNQQGNHCVVVSPIPYDQEPLSVETVTAAPEYTHFCASGFEAFLYRFWLENKLWFALSDSQPLTEEQQHYLDQYKS